MSGRFRSASAAAALAGLVSLAACTTSSEVGRFDPKAKSTADAAAGPETIELEPTRARIAASSDGTCALTSASAVRCWGDNRYGTLGNGDDTVELSDKPVSVRNLPGDSIAIFGGLVGQCAASGEGTARCWGDVVFGTFENMPQTHFVTYSPVAVDGLHEVAAIALGTYFSCALTRSGRVKCWGTGSAGQLGNGSTEDRFVPTDVPLPGPAISIAAGQGTFFACAVLADGMVSCWGENDSGQLGKGDRAGTKKPGFTSPLPEKAKAVTAGRAHACALLESGKVACWGANDESQLGMTGGDRLQPTLVSGVEGARVVAAGGRQTCILQGSGDVACFGEQSAAANVVARGAVEVAVGFRHGCALREDERIQCWGDDSRGQLGPFSGAGAAL